IRVDFNAWWESATPTMHAGFRKELRALVSAKLGRPTCRGSAVQGSQNARQITRFGLSSTRSGDRGTRLHRFSRSRADGQQVPTNGCRVGRGYGQNWRDDAISAHSSRPRMVALFDGDPQL